MTRASRAPWFAGLLLLAGCCAAVLLLHLPLLNLPYYWDEAGYYIPAARDLFHTGDLIPRSTLTGPHPPLLSVYLAAAWALFGESPAVTRVAMALVAGAALYALLLLAAAFAAAGAQVEGAGPRAAMGLWAAALTGVSPVFFAQSTLAHLDVAATLGTLLVLYFYVRRKLAACALAGALLCLVRETGAVVVLTVAALEWFETRAWRRALLLLVPLLPLAAWLALLRWRTGLWLGDAQFAAYNVWDVLHPARWVLQLAKRVYQLAVSNFQWAATLLILPAVVRDGRCYLAGPRRALVAALATHVAFMSVFGGAALARYLLPAFALFFLLASEAAFRRPWRARGAVLALLPLAFVLCWFWNPPYPYPYEDNLAYADFVRLHRDAAPLLEQLPAGTRVLTAWPASDELARPWLGYVSRPLTVAPVSEFSEDQLGRISADDFDALFLFSRQWRPEWFDRYPRLAAWQRRFFGHRRQADEDWIRARFKLERRMRLELRGQWAEIWARPGLPSSPAGSYRPVSLGLRASSRCLIVGFMGGRDRRDNRRVGVGRLAEKLRGVNRPDLAVAVFENRRRGEALQFVEKAIEGGRDSACVILYGQSFGGAAVVKFARQLHQRGIPVRLTVQVDSVGLGDALIPPNVRRAANLYQSDGWFIRGEPVIRAEGPAKTEVIGNFRFSYKDRRVDVSGLPWYKKIFRVAHSKMDRDREVWSTVERLILEAASEKGKS